MWAADGLPPTTTSEAILWQAYRPSDAPGTWISLPLAVAERTAQLRTQYLSWLHEAGVRLAPHLMIRSDLSAWWLALPAEFPFEPTARPWSIVRVLALRDVLDELIKNAPDADLTLALVCDDQATADLLTIWATEQGYPWTLEVRNGPAISGGLRAALSGVLAAHPWLAGLRTFLGHIRVLRWRAPKTLDGDGPVFVDYLAHLPQSARATGRFASNYWGPLARDVPGSPPVRWLHISGRQASHAVLGEDRRLTAAFDANGPGRHALIHDWLTPAALLAAGWDWQRQVRMWRRIRRRELTDDRATTHLLRQALREDLVGRTGALNTIWLRCFDRAMRSIGAPTRRFYLMENQPWELAMLTAWRGLPASRRVTAGPIVGVVHSSVSAWNTRAFKDPRDMFGAGLAQMPWPDLVAVNGPLARRRCLEHGYPPQRLIDAEALRYLAMGDAIPSPRQSGPPRVMLFGEYDADTTDALLGLVGEALAELGTDPETRGALTPNVRFRPHPAGEDRARIPAGIEVHRGGFMSEALAWADIAVCGPLSTVVLESLCAGCRTVVVADPHVIDANPADGLPGATTVHSPAELVRILRDSHVGDTHGSNGQDEPRTISAEEIFFLDPQLPRWRQLLA